ncbi:MAG TPA: glycoside hydrolase family 3 C-terminal domain-containing protein [Polyangiaceae bacterium]|nr:glycoside hydrolase family 3 C-terminal domain-containing protein [Polyangiaceae bacterium]
MVGSSGRRAPLFLLVLAAAACGTHTHGDDDSGNGRAGAGAAGLGAGGGGGTTAGGNAGTTANPGGAAGNAGAAAGEAGASGASANQGGSGGTAGDAGSAGTETNAGQGGAAEPITTLDLSGLDPSVLAYPAAAGVDDALARATDLVNGLTLNERETLTFGSGYSDVVGSVPAVGSLPTLTMDDGPGGVANLTGVTAFPDPITLAATWDRDLVERWGAAMGAEERAKGVMIQLGPMMNLSRSPLGGRNFEGFGEDPYLSAELAARDVTGIQSNHIVATAKHFVGNEQESYRMSENSLIDERTLHEIYYLPFEASVSAGVGAVMCSYNMLNGVYACENPTSLGDLKNGLGFSGWVMSDWTATHSGAASIDAGLDMEMPYGEYFPTDLASVGEARIDDMATRIVTSLVRTGALDDPPTGTTTDVATTDEHAALALEAATEGITLLKNDGPALPLDDGVKSIAVIGGAAYGSTLTTGTGSADVIGDVTKTPLDSLTARASGATVTYEAGDTGDDSAAVAAAATADAAVVFVAVTSGEGADRASLSLPALDDALIGDVAAVNPRTIVVLDVPGAVLMPWLDQVSGVVVAWYPGQENGDAIASVLFGDTNPSGKLPVTFPADATTLPLPAAPNVDYSEGLAVGYRALDAAAIDPLFPFGFGLSYTRFHYGDLALHAGTTPGAVDVSFTLANTGALAGTETAEVYLGFPPAAGEPPRVLRGFERVAVDAGASREVHVELPPRAFTCWNPTAHARYAPSGTYTVSVGGSSRDLVHTVTLDVTGLGPQP